MVEKFVADGYDITDLFYWPPPSGRGGGLGVGSRFELYPLADKAERVDRQFRSSGTFTVKFYFVQGSSNEFYVRYVKGDLCTTPRGGKDTATITMEVVGVGQTRERIRNARR